MKTKHFLPFLVVGVLASCGQEPISIEEKILMRSFASITAAQAYDHICRDDSLRKLKQDDKAFMNLYGNTQMLVTRIGGFMHERLPKDTIEMAIKRLQDTQKLIAMKTEAALKKDGCEGETAKAAKSALELFTGVHPARVHAMIDDEIIKSGGTPILEKVKASEAEKSKSEVKDPDAMTVEQIQNAEPQAGVPDSGPSFDQKVKAQFLAK